MKIDPDQLTQDQRAHLLEALDLMETALALIDANGRPDSCDSHLDQAIEALRETLDVSTPRPPSAVAPRP